MFAVTVGALQDDQIVEWVSKDNNYHCRYTYKAINDQTSELEYYEWVDSGVLDRPFSESTLRKLKQVLES